MDGYGAVNYVNSTVQGLQTYPDLSIRITSDLRVSLLARNKLINSSIDIYAGN